MEMAKVKKKSEGLIIKVEIWFMWQGLSSGNECIVEGVVHEVVKGGGVQVGKGGQSTAEVGGALLCTKYATESKIMCFLEVFSTQKQVQ